VWSVEESGTRTEAGTDVGHPNNPYNMLATKLQNTKQIQEALHQNAALEASVTAQLSQLLASTEPINAALDRLSGLTPVISNLQDEARILRTHVSHTATTADRVGSRVKALDEEMRRVREAAERVAQVTELKVSSWISSLPSSNSHSPLFALSKLPSTRKNGSLPLSTVHAQWRSQTTSPTVDSQREQSCVPSIGIIRPLLNTSAAHVRFPSPSSSNPTASKRKAIDHLSPSF
jgi:hypothetical protein